MCVYLSVLCAVRSLSWPIHVNSVRHEPCETKPRQACTGPQDEPNLSVFKDRSLLRNVMHRLWLRECQSVVWRLCASSLAMCFFSLGQCKCSARRRLCSSEKHGVCNFGSSRPARKRTVAAQVKRSTRSALGSSIHKPGLSSDPLVGWKPPKKTKKLKAWLGEETSSLASLQGKVAGC